MAGCWDAVWWMAGWLAILFGSDDDDDDDEKKRKTAVVNECNGFKRDNSKGCLSNEFYFFSLYIYFLLLRKKVLIMFQTGILLLFFCKIIFKKRFYYLVIAVLWLQFVETKWMLYVLMICCKGRWWSRDRQMLSVE